ncbi:MAG: reverse transcriptase family protein, partial [Gammaproteobacteria bacterium]|nr:reverse transcriptase family protein [Gammaproteobacteria bacterium]
MPLKIGKQTPVHKGGDICLSNYRPITVCSSISKILEKVVRDRVMDYVKRINILNKYQFGFRSKHNTNHAIINLTEATLDAIDNGLKSGGVYLDISKAFDTIDHNILLRKLEFYGFRANTLMWFESYLKHRTNYVQIRKSKSQSYTIECGVPQGGTLAPILFILYTNDIV